MTTTEVTPLTKILTALLAALALTASSVAFTQDANAATTLGSKCVANGGPMNVAIVDAPIATSPINGVIVRWGFSFPAAPPTYPQQLMVVSEAGGGNLTVQSIEAPLVSNPGLNVRDSRIAIKAGQLIGSWGAGGTLTCVATGPSASAFPQAVVPAVGGTLAGGVQNNINAALFADVEADADADGFGDETQDLCPQGAQFQIACPTPVLAALKVAAASGFRAAVTTSIPTTVAIAGTVKLPKTKGKRAKTLKFKGKTVATTPGLLKTVSVKWPKSLLAALNKLDSKKSLKITITLTADGVLTDAVKKFSVRLKGRA